MNWKLNEIIAMLVGSVLGIFLILNVLVMLYLTIFTGYYWTYGTPITNPEQFKSSTKIQQKEAKSKEQPKVKIKFIFYENGCFDVKHGNTFLMRCA